MTEFKRNIVFPDMGLKVNMLYLEKQDKLREMAFHWNRREMIRLYFISQHSCKAIAHPVDPRALSTSPRHAKTQGVQPICPLPVGGRGMFSMGYLCSAGSQHTGWRKQPGQLNRLELGPNRNAKLSDFLGKVPNCLNNSRGMYSRKKVCHSLLFFPGVMPWKQSIYGFHTFLVRIAVISSDSTL